MLEQLAIAIHVLASGELGGEDEVYDIKCGFSLVRLATLSIHAATICSALLLFTWIRPSRGLKWNTILISLGMNAFVG